MAGPVKRKRGARKSVGLPAELIAETIEKVQRREKRRQAKVNPDAEFVPLSGIDLDRAVYVALAANHKSKRIRLSLDGWHSEDLKVDDGLQSDWNSQIVTEIRYQYVSARYLGKTAEHYDTNQAFVDAVKAEIAGNTELQEDLAERFRFTRKKTAAERPGSTESAVLFGDWDDDDDDFEDYED